MSGVAGLVVRVGGASYFVPADRVGFVARVREVRDGRLVMPRGDLALVDPEGTDPGRRAAAVAVRQGAGFVAIAVDAVELADPERAAQVRPFSALEQRIAPRDARPRG